MTRPGDLAGADVAGVDGGVGGAAGEGVVAEAAGAEELAAVEELVAGAEEPGMLGFGAVTWPVCCRNMSVSPRSKACRRRLKAEASSSRWRFVRSSLAKERTKSCSARRSRTCGSASSSAGKTSKMSWSR